MPRGISNKDAHLAALRPLTDAEIDGTVTVYNAWVRWWNACEVDRGHPLPTCEWEGRTFVSEFGKPRRLFIFRNGHAVVLRTAGYGVFRFDGPLIGPILRAELDVRQVRDAWLYASGGRA